MTMKTRMFAPLISGLLLVGCGQVPTGGLAPTSGVVATDELMAVEYDLQPASAGYSVASVDETAAIQVKTVAASSTRNDYFRAAYAIDGNLSSAWAPAATDAAPTLTLALGGVKQVADISLKMSHVNATVDVAVRTNGGAWKTIATGLAPVPTTLSDLDMASCQADEVRLTFRGADVADLLVCEAQVRGSAATSTPAPGPVPSATPMPDDEGAATDEPCTTSGGGWLPVEDAQGPHKICFAFLAESSGPACRGTIVVEDLTLHQRYVGVVTRLTRHGNVVTFAGRLESGVAFVATVVDHGRHGKRDTFSFATDDGVLFCGALAPTAHGGRIKVVKKTVTVVEETELAALGVGVVKSSDRIDLRLKDLDDACERDEDHADQAVGHRKHRNKKHDD